MEYGDQYVEKGSKEGRLGWPVISLDNSMELQSQEEVSCMITAIS